MPGIKGHEYTWSKSWIEFKAPDAPGVYCLRDKEGKVLFIGKGKVRERLLSHWNRENSTDEAIWNHGGWRIYEGGGGVKGKILVLCFEWRSEQPPYPKLGGCERGHTFPSTLLRRFLFGFSASASSLIYPVSKTRMSIRSRERPNQMREVDVPTMRHPRCAPELFLLAAAAAERATRAASGRRQ